MRTRRLASAEAKDLRDGYEIEFITREDEGFLRRVLECCEAFDGFVGGDIGGEEIHVEHFFDFGDGLGEGVVGGGAGSFGGWASGKGRRQLRGSKGR